MPAVCRGDGCSMGSERIAGTDGRDDAGGPAPRSAIAVGFPAGMDGSGASEIGRSGGSPAAAETAEGVGSDARGCIPEPDAVCGPAGTAWIGTSRGPSASGADAVAAPAIGTSSTAHEVVAGGSIRLAQPAATTAARLRASAVRRGWPVRDSGRVRDAAATAFPRRTSRHEAGPAARRRGCPGPSGVPSSRCLSIGTGRAGDSVVRADRAGAPPIASSSPWGKSTAAGCGGSRPGRTSAFPDVDFVEKGQG